jgi:hypothetical protein
MSEDGEKSENSPHPTSVKFHFIKSPLFRVLHVDGAYGGVGPHGHIHMAVFNERTAIPQLVEHEISPTGQLGKELDRVSKDGVIRELEGDLVFDVETAKALVVWIKDKIDTIEQSKNALQKKQD